MYNAKILQKDLLYNQMVLQMKIQFVFKLLLFLCWLLGFDRKLLVHSTDQENKKQSATDPFAVVYQTARSSIC